jgi:hypothetical protein
MMFLKGTLLAAFGFATTVLGHGYVTTFTTDGTSNQGFLCMIAAPSHGLACSLREMMLTMLASGLLLPEG